MTCTPDVVVIGAGAAGLAAGVRLMEAGADFRVLEAASVRGGRAATDRETLGVPFDLGCHWLHDARANPFVPIARALGFAFDDSRGCRRGSRVHLGARFATPDEARDAEDAVEAAFEAVTAHGRAGHDVAASEVLPDLGRWEPLARHWLSLMSAAPPDRISTLDFSLYRDTEDNWPVLDGYGDLVLAHARHVPVTLNCPVTRIDHSGPRIVIESGEGTLHCRIVIVAVSTAVVAKGRLSFSPALPPHLGEAFAALPLGVAEKVALLFDKDVFGVAPRTGLDAFDESRAEALAVSAILNPAGVPAAVVHIAGPDAGALVRAGEGAMVDFAASALGRAFGPDLKRHVRRARVSRWSAQPFIGGAYSCALPGAGDLRHLLAEGLDARIFFAGEAVGGPAFSTAHGAHLSGIAAAEAALARLGPSSHD
ncbi:flavin monoamine oxidase family protein [Xanthobacter agilis]|uniref:flavin monoamine oxidase family protein n=1 Tax=Xanthobacter agilis TaxID=47492 RepID=UPI003726F2D5